MVKPEPSPILPRLISAALAGGCVWLLLRSIVGAPSLSDMLAERQLAPYVAALSAGDIPKARAAFDREIKSNPANPDTYKVIAQACVQQQKYDLAIEYVNRGLDACKNAPGKGRALLYAMLSECYSFTEKSKPQKLAISMARNALDLDPENPQYLNAYGYLLADNGEQLVDATVKIGHALEILKKLPDTPGTRFSSAQAEDSYGWALYKQHKYDAAVSAINQAIADMPQEATDSPTYKNDVAGIIYYHLGAAYRGQKSLDRARTALQTAVQYAPNLKEAAAEFAALKADLAAAQKAQPGVGKPGSAAGTGAGTGVTAKPTPAATANPAPVAAKPPIGKFVNASGSSKGYTSAVKPAPVAGKPSTGATTPRGPEKRP